MMKPIQLWMICILLCIITVPVFAQSEWANIELKPVRWERDQVVYQMTLPSGISTEISEPLISDLNSRKGVELRSYDARKGVFNFAAPRSYNLIVFSDLDKYLPQNQPPEYFLEGSSSSLFSYISENIPSHILPRLREIKVMSISTYENLNETDRTFIDENEDLYFVSSNMTLAGAYEELVEELLTK